jgi:hypothetical protein
VHPAHRVAPRLPGAAGPPGADAPAAEAIAGGM